ncbi:MAG TPA: hypothetical protein VH396_04705 [Chitinophagaceae bacterium]
MKRKFLSVSGMILLILVLINVIILKTAYLVSENWYWCLIVSLPLLLVAIYDVRQKQHAMLCNYPVIGHLRYFFESIRSELRQYFFETDLDGKPFNRRQRSTREIMEAGGFKNIKSIRPANSSEE